MSKVFKLLASGILLIDQTEFAKLSTTDASKLFADHVGKPPSFVKSFSQFANKADIRRHLLEGKDVSLALEYLGVEVTEEEQKALALARTIADKVYPLSKYDWLPPLDKKPALIDRIDNRSVRRNSFTLTKTQCQRVWRAASYFWATGATPKGMQLQYEWSKREVSFATDGVKIGCQVIPRIEVEYIARHYGWEPNVEGEK